MLTIDVYIPHTITPYLELDQDSIIKCSNNYNIIGTIQDDCSYHFELDKLNISKIITNNYYILIKGVWIEMSFNRNNYEIKKENIIVKARYKRCEVKKKRSYKMLYIKWEKIVCIYNKPILSNLIVNILC